MASSFDPRSKPSWKVPDRENVLELINLHSAIYYTMLMETAPTSSIRLEDADYHEVKNLSVKEVEEKLEALKKKLDDAEFSLISRGKSNQTYRACSDGVKRYALKDINKCFKPRAEKREAIRYMIDLIIQSFKEEKRPTLAKLNTSSSALDDICCAIGCTRSSLNVDASVRGVVGGLLSIKIGKYKTLCTRRDDGEPIPPFMHSDIILKNRGAKFVLVVEDKSAFNTLMQDKFYVDYPCIIITGMGMPEVGSRSFLNVLSEKFKIPVYGLFDCDPAGIEILSVYAAGSYNKSYDSVNLTCPDMMWLGVWPSDLHALKIPCKDLTSEEIRKVNTLLEEDFVKEYPTLLEELQLMKKKKKKANLEALEKFGRTCLTKYYLPYKLKYLLTDTD
ncbi:DNA topoisomerase 6 subunit A-like [Rosa rugosa]|uniref:DNA topoisomerase 6 subunit A-like n=1 Tax=Rosa rugosa TaxID=74645 RepID=UPI002B408454|nr:DNA topoisomerase 6 subunit A-like [Rosa rugosa]